MVQDRGEILIKGGVVVTSEGFRRSDMSIVNGSIEKLELDIGEKGYKRVIDASKKLILPGLFDVHVHPAYMDGFESLSKSAASGGITTLIHYIYVRPGMDIMKTMEDNIREGSEKSYLDFSLHAGLFNVNKQIPYIRDVIKMGISSFKMFVAFPRREGMMVSDYELLSAMEVISENNGLTMVHAENGWAAEYLEERFIKEGKVGASYFGLTRPNIIEAEACFRTVSLASIIKCPIYLVHLSAPESLEVVRKFREAGQTIYAETCPQYLLLTAEEMERRGALAKVAPPLREKDDLPRMWKAINEGLVDVIASDHCGMTKEYKGGKDPTSVGSRGDNIFEKPFAAPGTETMLTGLYEGGVNRGKITLLKLVELLAENPAKIFGLYPNKGTIRVGSDADLVVFDPFCLHTLPDSSYGVSDYSLYAGWSCLGRVAITMQRGRIVMEDGEVKGKRGNGKFLPTKIGQFGIKSRKGIEG